MHEVKVYDSTGNLKQVISVNTLIKREDQKSEFPNLFRRNKKVYKPRGTTPEPAVKTKTP